ncbi:MAG: hypothetical protein O2782_00635 [bacterium]|nr:hypothetical protein [bacterium]
MNRTIDRYLQRRTQNDLRTLQGLPRPQLRSVVAIPALGEFPGILDTLGDLARCPGSDQTVVIVVVNNRPPAQASADDIDRNRQTLAALREWDQQRLNVTWIDASSPGHELPAKEGVGLARKIGLDWGLQILATQDHLQVPLVCLDGDTRVDEGYLAAVHDFFASPSRWAGILPYAHPITGEHRQQAAILCYEFFLRYHALQLTWAASPYGYHAIGSAMACTPTAYAAISGMNRRQAGEDFYFLQQLAKTGVVETIPGTIVRPSGRASHRVPFGTGRRVQRFLAGGEDEYRLYHPDSYAVIRDWLAVAVAHGGRDSVALLSAAGAIHGQLRDFLAVQNFAQAWDHMRDQAASNEALTAQFHRWFDGLRTVQCIHHLRDTVWRDAPMFAAMDVLLQRLQRTATVELNSELVEDLPRQVQLLEQLRAL